MGHLVRHVRRVPGSQHRLLPLSSQLHHAGLWRLDHDTSMATAGSAGSHRWNADVRSFDGNDLCAHSMVDPGAVCGFTRVGAVNLLTGHICEIRSTVHFNSTLTFESTFETLRAVQGK